MIAKITKIFRLKSAVQDIDNESSKYDFDFVGKGTGAALQVRMTVKESEQKIPLDLVPILKGNF